MSADPTPQTYPLLFAVVQQHIDYYREAGEYPTKAHILSDLRKDSQYAALLDESGISPGNGNALSTFRQVFWRVVRYYMNPDTGWWARSTGRSASFFHVDWGTPEDCRDAVNIRIHQREQDMRRLEQIYRITEEKCGQLGWIFDPQTDDSGTLVAIEVWRP